MCENSERKKKFKKWAMFTAATVMMVGAVIEGGTRLAIMVTGETVKEFREDYYNAALRNPPEKTDRTHYHPGIFTQHPYLPYVLKPGITHTWTKHRKKINKTYDVDINTNAFGLRGPEISLRRPANTFRVLCLGGSTTFGVIPEKDTWPRTLERMLQKAHPNRKVEVINAGVPSYTSADSLVSYALRWVELQPNVVTVYHLVNDYEMSIYYPFYADYSHVRKDFPVNPVWIDHMPSWFEGSAVFCLLRWKFFPDRRNNIKNLIMTKRSVKYNPIGMFVLKRNLRSIIAIAKEHNTHVILSTVHFIPKFPKKEAKNYKFLKECNKWNNVVVALAAEMDNPLVDNFNLIPGDSLLHTDSFHFTPAGAALVAKNYFEEIERQGWIDDYFKPKLNGSDRLP